MQRQSDKTGDTETMTEYITNPLQRAVTAAIGFLTTEELLCEGHTVNLKDLRDSIGFRLVIEEKKLCMSHVRSLASSIMKHGAVILPIIIERKNNEYVVKDGFHRLAAVELVKKQNPDVNVSVRVKLYNSKKV